MSAPRRHKVKTRGQGDAHDITDVVASAVKGITSGLVTVFVVGSTAGITTIEFEPGAVADLNSVFEDLAPRQGQYRHHERWGDDNGSSHVRAAMLGPSLTQLSKRRSVTSPALVARHAGLESSVSPSASKKGRCDTPGGEPLMTTSAIIDPARDPPR